MEQVFFSDRQALAWIVVVGVSAYACLIAFLRAAPVVLAKLWRIDRMGQLYDEKQRAVAAGRSMSPRSDLSRTLVHGRRGVSLNFSLDKMG